MVIRTLRAARSAFAFAVAAGCCAAPAAALTQIPAFGGKGGGPFRSTCSGDVAVGIYVRAGAWIDAIGLKCASFDAASGRFRRPAWNKAFDGGYGGSPQTALCPGESYVSGLKLGFTREVSEPKYIDYVEVACTPVGGGEVHRICLQSGEGCWDSHPSPPGFQIPSAPFLPGPDVQTCPPGEAAVGLHGRSGTYLDAVGLLCGPKPAIAAPAPAAPAQPKVIRPLGRQFTQARNDVDVYDGPGGQFRVIGMMRGGTSARILQRHPDGWCRLQGVAGGGDGWVAADHLTRCLR